MSKTHALINTGMGAGLSSLFIHSSLQEAMTYVGKTLASAQSYNGVTNQADIAAINETISFAAHFPAAAATAMIAYFVLPLTYRAYRYGLTMDGKPLPAAPQEPPKTGPRLPTTPRFERHLQHLRYENRYRR